MNKKSFSNSHIKAKSLDLLKIYSKDKNLFKIINRTKNVINKNPFVEEEKDLKETLQKLKKNFKFAEEPKIRNLKLQNEDFSFNYKKIQKKKKKNLPEETFRGLIEEYKEKGYKIPNLTLSHNIFRMNPLIEDNNDKIIDGLYLNYKEVSESGNFQNNIATKSLIYLRKLRQLIEDKIVEFKILQKQNNNYIIDNNTNNKLIDKIEVKMPNINVNRININKFESKKELLKNIQMLLDLIKEEPLKDFTKTNHNFASKSNRNLKFIQKSNHQSRRNSKSVRIFSKKHSRRISNSKVFTKKFLKLKQTFMVQNPLRKKSSNLIEMKSSDLFSINHMKPFNLNTTKNNLIPKINFQEQNSENLISSHRSRNSNYNNHELNTLPQTERNENEYLNSNNVLTTNFSVNDFPYNNEKDFIKFAYESCLQDNFNDVENYLRKYLIIFKGFTDKKIDDILIRFNKNIFLNGINDIKGIIKRNKIYNKSEIIYLHEHIIQRIKPKLKKMLNEEKLLRNIDKNYVKVFLND